MRMRSPRIAPDENGLLGSTARIPTRRCSAARESDQLVHQRALAGARRTRDADRQRPSGIRKQKPAEFPASGTLVLNQAGRARERTKITLRTFSASCSGGIVRRRASTVPLYQVTPAALKRLLARAEVRAAVLLITRLGGIRADRPFLAETDRLQLVAGDAESNQRVFGCRGSPVTETNVVLSRATLVAMAFNDDGDVREDSQRSSSRLRRRR